MVAKGELKNKPSQKCRVLRANSVTHQFRWITIAQKECSLSEGAIIKPSGLRLTGLGTVYPQLLWINIEITP